MFLAWLVKSVPDKSNSDVRCRRYRPVIEALEERCMLAVAITLHRAANPGGLNAYTSALQHGLSNEQVALTLMGSTEYFSRV
jgi:hypothetical protein